MRVCRADDDDGVDRWIVSKMLKLGDDFTDMVERYRTLDVQAIAGRVLPGAPGATSSVGMAGADSVGEP